MAGSLNNTMEVDIGPSDLTERSLATKHGSCGFLRASECATKGSDPEQSIDLSVRPRKGSSSERVQCDTVHEHSTGHEGWPRDFDDQSDKRSKDRSTLISDASYRERVNGHVNGFSDFSHLNSVDSDMVEMHSLCVPRELTVLERKHHEDLMHRLKEELRNEEMKLVLLKKLKQSQSVKESLVNVPTSTISGPATSLPSAAPSVTTVSGMNLCSSKTGSNGRLGQQTMSRNCNKFLKSAIHQSLLMPSVNHTSTHALLSGSSSAGSISSLSANLMLQQSMLRPGMLSSRVPVTTPPNVVVSYHNMQGTNSTVKSVTASTSTQNQVSASQVTSNTTSPTHQPPVPAPHADRAETHQTSAQRQAAAKLALRKQLEKTLLQIPPPKPPPPEMHFLPNASNPEFVYLLGLEVVVSFLIREDQRQKPPPDPFDCVQCCTDYTPVWKWQDTSLKESLQQVPAVICESCVTSNIKKALKAEHTNRLKTAFVKALQQEQEIEQCMSQGSSSPPPLCTTPPVGSSGTCTMPAVQRTSTPPTSHSPVPRSLSVCERGSAAANAVAVAVANSAALLQQMPKFSAAHQSLLQAQHFQQLAQQHHPQPAHMLPFGPLLAAQAYSYGMMGKSSLSTSDLQRQYLLDMIPPRSMSHNSMNWKT